MAAGAEKLVEYSLLAVERALAAYAWEEAQTHFERGLTARAIPFTGDQPAPDGKAAALLFGLARAQAATGQRQGDTLGIIGESCSGKRMTTRSIFQLPNR